MTLVLVVAFPFAAFAVTGSNVFVTDATSGAHAKVDTGGKVQVTTNATTAELRSGNGVALAAGSKVLVPSLDVSKQGQIRLTVGNSSFSASSVQVSITHIENPGTQNASAIDLLDTITVPIGANVSRSYAVPGRVIAVSAFPTNHQTGSTLFFTIFGR